MIRFGAGGGSGGSNGEDVMTESIEEKARQLLGHSRIMLGFGPNTGAAGSAQPSGLSAPLQAARNLPPDTTDRWLRIVYMTVTAFIGFMFTAYWFLRCFEMPTPRSGIDHPGLLPLEIMAYGLCGLGVVFSAVCLVALAVKICIQVIKE